jgi:protein-tyrosine phosphatase
MAEALLRDRLRARGIDAQVHSAGELSGGVPASAGSVRAMAARGLDLGEHRSRPTTAAMLEEADLVVAMARRHLRAAVAAMSTAFPRTFTLKELVRRAADAGPRLAGESLDAWLDRLHDGRTVTGLLGDDAADDIADPIGGPDRLYEATAQEIEALVDRFLDLAFDHMEDLNRETA